MLQSGDFLENGVPGKKTGFVPFGAGAHGHQLDEPYLPGVLPGEVYKIVDLVVIEAADEDRVQLQIVKARCLRRFNAGQRIREMTKPGHLRKPVRPQRIQADVQPVQPGFPQGSR